ncbi:hypothetical protein GXP70_18270 [Paenibacillus lycopersici]|uniref:Uncharacterized protein n=1 Tax=Paenibacillus lycopersici TaxID=2704462 RepID=A0A6C0FXC7_9BACL|nr:hypothetical protein [Paenibacillus lycopersici]QHT61728.1 hypothetical protein GXP70_18270 [Paenibacillus lycopersici]
MDLSKVSIADLVAELASRDGVDRISVGAYQQYELRKKYGADRDQISAETVLVVNYLET